MRHFGIPPATALEQAQKNQERPADHFQPLPAPTGTAPYRLALETVLPQRSATERRLHVIGDHGGVKDPHPQLAVAAALEQDQGNVDFCYSVGDVVYFSGEESEYPNQFYEPYAHYNKPILAIPGNHDGESEGAEPSLLAFMSNFCALSPELPARATEENRDTMTQPNCYWTLTDELVTIIGLYSNVPAGGRIEPDQRAWFVGELKAAPKGVALIVALHHPPYSCDAFHGGSAAMGRLLDEAFVEAQRDPDLVLAGHVHNMQRFTRSLAGRQVPYVVIGNGGYHHLHALASGASVGLRVTPDTTLEAFDGERWGFLRLTVTPTAIAGEYVAVTRDGTVIPNADSFSVPIA